MTVELGKTYTDRLTEFVGRATARCEYLGGHTDVLLEAKDRDGHVVKEWFSDDRLEP